jgi:predicted N-acyltransferase
MELHALSSIQDIPTEDWDQLNVTGYPFLQHAFLASLETHGAATSGTGWQPSHLTLYDGERLVAAAPAYLKAHSWGEFVFDFAWADAYERHGGRYYPKLVVAVPFTPATGPRLLCHSELPRAQAATALADGARQVVARYGLSSSHWLYPDPDDARHLANAGYSIRHGCQFHWYNPGYPDFEAFLATLSSRKRKNIRRERRRITDAGLRLRVLHGDEADAGLWDALHRFYRTTFELHGNLPLVSRDCFAAMGQSLGWRMVLVVAERDGEPIAGAICFRDSEALYGRYWGCDTEYDGLHFETCYYQGIEYCIRHGLSRFEPGAQGEHKVARGFIPTLTRSAHDFPDRNFAQAVGDFIERERQAVHEYAESLTMEGPYREGQRPAVACRSGP